LAAASEKGDCVGELSALSIVGGGTTETAPQPGQRADLPNESSGVRIRTRQVGQSNSMGMFVSVLIFDWQVA
jgi:hypothetical protein